MHKYKKAEAERKAATILAAMKPLGIAAAAENEWECVHV